MSHRYFLQISYIGTHFRGLQKNLFSQKYDMKSSVQGSIESALRKFSPVNEPKLVLSSRTDTGVHALHSGVHIDLESPSGKPFPVEKVTLLMNKYFDRQNLQIRIQNTEIVPDTFHARFSAKRRTYLYRLAIAKQQQLSPEGKLASIPIDEYDRCHFVHYPKFDIAKARKAAELIQGKHDFRTFMGVGQQNSDRPFYALRVIDSIKIEAGESASNIFSKPFADANFNYFDVQISGRSFLNRQVRRIVAVIVGVAQDNLTLRDVYEMLTIPSRHSWCPNVAVVPACGLYLCKVDYDNKDKEFPVSDSDTDRVEPTDDELLE